MRRSRWRSAQTSEGVGRLVPRLAYIILVSISGENNVPGLEVYLQAPDEHKRIVEDGNEEVIESQPRTKLGPRFGVASTFHFESASGFRHFLHVNSDSKGPL